MSGTSTARRRLGVVLALCLVHVLVLSLAPQVAAAQTGNRGAMLDLTNDDRVEHDRDPLDLTKRLSRIAKEHSREMAKAGTIFHSTDLVDVLSPFDWSIGGENVGVGGSLEGLEDAFMASPQHRRNILRKSFDYAGIGVIKQDGMFWVTVIFYG